MKKKILFVGTQVDVSEIWADIFEVLEEEGYDVITVIWEVKYNLRETPAGSGTWKNIPNWDADRIYSMLQTENPDLVIVHFGRTDIRREQATGELHILKTKTDSPILVVSASSLLFEEADGFIVLPITLDHLLIKIREYI